MKYRTPTGWLAAGLASLAVAVLCPSQTGAQVFDQIVDSAVPPMIPQTAYSVVETSAGGYITAGGIGPAGASDIQVINYAPDGTIIWEFTADVAASDDIAYSVIEDSTTGDFLVAGYSDALTIMGGPATKELFVMRLDAGGALIWYNHYDGTMTTDPIHFPDPGPSIIEQTVTPFPGRLSVVANLGGLPTYTEIDPAGSVTSGAVYSLPPGFPATAFAFTDLTELVDGTIGISGSIVTRLPSPAGAPFSTRTLFVRVTAPGGFLSATVYAIHPAYCAPGAVFETGHGIDDRDSDGFVYITGMNDDGGSSIDPMTGATFPNATHVLIIDPFPVPLAPATTTLQVTPTMLHLCTPDFESLTPAYATLRTDPTTEEPVIGLTFGSTGGLLPGPVATASALLVLDPFLSVKTFWHYADETKNESAVRHLSTCGYVLAGGAYLAPAAAPPFTPDAIHLVKTDDAGLTFCTERPYPFQDVFLGPMDAPINLNLAPITPEVPVSIAPFTFGSTIIPFCTTPTCTLGGACCYPCVGGVQLPCLSVPSAADCAALSGCWQGLGTSCTDPGICPCPADVNCDGIVNLADFNILGINFNAGPGATRSQGDLNCDGFVNLADFNVLGIGFGCM